MLARSACLDGWLLAPWARSRAPHTLRADTRSRKAAPQSESSARPLAHLHPQRRTHKGLRAHQVLRRHNAARRTDLCRQRRRPLGLVQPCRAVLGHCAHAGRRHPSVLRQRTRTCGERHRAAQAASLACVALSSGAELRSATLCWVCAAAHRRARAPQQASKQGGRACCAQEKSVRARAPQQASERERRARLTVGERAGEGGAGAAELAHAGRPPAAGAVGHQQPLGAVVLLRPGHAVEVSQQSERQPRCCAVQQLAAAKRGQQGAAVAVHGTRTAQLHALQRTQTAGACTRCTRVHLEAPMQVSLARPSALAARAGGGRVCTGSPGGAAAAWRCRACRRGRGRRGSRSAPAARWAAPAATTAAGPSAATAAPGPARRRRRQPDTCDAWNVCRRCRRGAPPPPEVACEGPAPPRCVAVDVARCKLEFCTHYATA